MGSLSRPRIHATRTCVVLVLRSVFFFVNIYSSCLFSPCLVKVFVSVDVLYVSCFFVPWSLSYLLFLALSLGVVLYGCLLFVSALSFLSCRDGTHPRASTSACRFSEVFRSPLDLHLCHEKCRIPGGLYANLYLFLAHVQPTR